jgi:hypothetical protein
MSKTDRNTVCVTLLYRAMRYEMAQVRLWQKHNLCLCGEEGYPKRPWDKTGNFS